MTAEGLPAFVASLDSGWRGLSLTMPLKPAVLPLLHETDEVARLTGGANTLVIDDGKLRGFNTDVYGIVEAFRAVGVDELETAQLLGGGATAASAIVALAELGARRVVVSVRTPAKAERLAVLGAELGMNVVVRAIGEADEGTPDAVISTLPGGVESGIGFPAAVRARAVLLDVAYDPWPSALARSWSEVGGTVVPGLDMLLHQALAQVRAFVGGNSDVVLPDEASAFAAMRASVNAF